MRAADLLAGGNCSPACLLGFLAGTECECLCGGRFHGLLADADVPVAGSARLRIRRRVAPKYSCHECQKVIQSTRAHYYAPDSGRVLCWKCFYRADMPSGLREFGSREALALHLGLWP